MIKYIKYFIIIIVLLFTTNVSAKTYGIVDNVDECNYDACFTELDEALTDCETVTDSNVINFESSKSEFKIKSHNFESAIRFSDKSRKEYIIDGEGSTLNSKMHFVFYSYRGTYFSLNNINFISNPTDLTPITLNVRRNNFDGGAIKTKLLTDYIGLSLINPKNVNNVTSTITGEFDKKRVAVFVANDYFLDDNDNIILQNVDLNNITTNSATISGITLMGGNYNLNNYISDFNISIHAFYNSVVNVNNSTLRSLISSEGATINVNYNNKWYENKKLYFLNKLISEDQLVISDETIDYIVQNDTYNYIVTDNGTINIKDFREEKVDLNNKRTIKISELFTYFGNVNLDEEDWISTNPNVATINNGLVTINSVGETIFKTTPKDTQTVLEYKLIVTEGIENPNTFNNLIFIIILFIISIFVSLLIILDRKKKEF